MTIASYPDEELKKRNRDYMEELNNRRNSDYSYSEKGSNFLNDFLYSLGGLIGGGVSDSSSQDPFAELLQKSRQNPNKSYDQFMTPCEECRSKQDPRVMNIADPCRGVC
jgi:hypothetical protein